ncbi:sterol desaturase family protein [Arachidicoccus terrestris]|uniref:sterol desaturase family protein n=1 Tax=Arachidicoccus terrestris TaxID=2875539 RepID=UPI001CC3DEE5|nr:sterol desaturase family protein [Arachidicoccus terrestris]
MAKNFVSNSTESTRMFKSSFLESLSKVHFTVPLFIFIPAIAFFIYRTFAVFHDSFLFFLGYYVLGLFVWTLTEYVLHRYIFHFHPSSRWGQRIHFIFHGVHHDYPRDKKRLVMPPSVSIPLALLFYFLFYLILPTGGALSSFFPGFLTGYLIYDMMHYAMHHYNFKSSLMKRIKQHHMLHHYQDEHKGFGVSSSLWDKIFISGFPKKKDRSQGDTATVTKTAGNKNEAPEAVI